MAKHEVLKRRTGPSVRLCGLWDDTRLGTVLCARLQPPETEGERGRLASVITQPPASYGSELCLLERSSFRVVHLVLDGERGGWC